MREIKGVLYFLIVNVRYTFIVFWTILAAIYGISILLSFFMKGSDVFFQPFIPIYIFSMVIGMWTVKNALPYLLKMGITRKLMYASIWLYFIAFSFLNVLLANVFPLISKVLQKEQTGGTFTLSDGEEEVAFDFSHLGQFLSKDDWLNRFSIDLIICFVALVCMFFIGLIFYQYGPLGGFSFIGLLFVLYFISLATDRFTKFIFYIYNHYSMVLFMQFFLFGLAIYGLAYLIMRRFTLK